MRVQTAVILKEGLKVWKTGGTAGMGKKGGGWWKRLDDTWHCCQRCPQWGLEPPRTELRAPALSRSPRQPGVVV